jgi:glycosyltransferase involved in cell wall biosynthesis
MPQLSVVVITYNEEKNIERCLKSVQWADEIIVVDSFSTDRTVDIAKRFTNNIITHAYDGEVPQRERGFAIAKCEWLFWLDADEEVSNELKNSIMKTTYSHDSSDGYYVPRKAWAFGKWIEHGGWSPDWQFRLVRKGKQVAEYQEIHGGFTTHGTTDRLNGYLYHYTYKDIAEYLRKMNDQTSLHVSNKLRNNPSIIVHWYNFILNPLSDFIRMFFSKGGYKDGMHGFILAAGSAMYNLLVYAKTWEYLFRYAEGKNILPPITNEAVQQAKRRYSTTS